MGEARTRLSTIVLVFLVNMVLNVHLEKPQGLLGTGRKREALGVWMWGKREIIDLSLYCHQQNDFCIKMGSDESHFNVSLILKTKS